MFAAWVLAGKSADGDSVKKSTGLNSSRWVSQGITGKSSTRGLCVRPKELCHVRRFWDRSGDNAYHQSTTSSFSTLSFRPTHDRIPFATRNDQRFGCGTREETSSGRLVRKVTTAVQLAVSVLRHPDVVIRKLCTSSCDACASMS